jgi:dihydropteroate synthase
MPEGSTLDATPSFRLPIDASRGVADMPPDPIEMRGKRLGWGERTYVMGIVNVTPDSFSGDGLLRLPGDASDITTAAVDQARRMVADGADVLDVGGESSKPGHDPVSEADELRRVVPIVAAIRAVMPDVPMSIDTVKPRVAEACLEAGADAINDVWAVGPSSAMARLAAERGVPYVLMHNREEARYRSVVAEVIADLSRAIERALALGCSWDALIVDPGIGFGKTAEQNLALLHELAALQIIGRPILLGASRKSTIGKVLDAQPDQRLEGTLAITALAVAAGVDMVRVHDVLPNARAARMADAIVRGGWREPAALVAAGAPAAVETGSQRATGTAP